MIVFLRIYRFKRRCGWGVINSLRAARDAFVRERGPLL